MGLSRIMNLNPQCANRDKPLLFEKCLRQPHVRWPDRAPSRSIGIGGIKGHNIKRNYLTGKPRPVAGGFTMFSEDASSSFCLGSVNK